ncbi:EH signature domain-containing protein, partial [Pseudanabaena mucicola]
MNLRLQLIPQSSPTKLAQLADDIPPSSQNIPNIDQIFEKINNGQSSNLSAVDCFWCVLKKAAWDNQQSPHEAINSSKQLWVAATQNKLLKYYLLRGYLRSYLENQPFSSSLKETFDSFENALTENDAIIKAIALIPMMGIYSVVPNSLKAQWGKHEILKFIQEHTGLVTIDLSEFTLEVTNFFAIESQNARIKSHSDNTSMSRWLVKCLTQEIDIIGKQVKAVETILIKVTKEDSEKYPEFVEWLKLHYQKGDLATYLSEGARRKLREWIGAVNFADFEKLVNIILYGEFINDDLSINTNKFLPRGSNERKLRSRKDFWSNYSDRFEQIRIFIPESSRKKIGDALYNEVTIIQAITEICIFDFDKLFVVEFFRGKGKDSEMRLFRGEEHTRQILFNSPLLSVNDIRDLGGEEKYHTGEWQKECERTLAKYGIYPNDGLSEFIFSGEDKRPYDRNKGILSKA